MNSLLFELKHSALSSLQCSSSSRVCFHCSVSTSVYWPPQRLSSSPYALQPLLLARAAPSYRCRAWHDGTRAVQVETSWLHRKRLMGFHFQKYLLLGKCPAASSGQRSYWFVLTVSDFQVLLEWTKELHKHICQKQEPLKSTSCSPLVMSSITLLIHSLKSSHGALGSSPQQPRNFKLRFGLHWFLRMPNGRLCLQSRQPTVQEPKLPEAHLSGAQRLSWPSPLRSGT